MKTKLFFALGCATCLIFTSCDDKSSPEPPVSQESKTASEDTTRFNGSSIVGLWACIASDNATYDIISGQTSYHWDYDPNAQTYDVYWYFNIKNNSQVQYINVESEADMGEYRKSDGYLHIAANSKWMTLVDANYIFEEKDQAIRCPSGKVLGFTLESVADILGTDTVFYVKRYGIDDAAIMDNTGFFQSQYVVRVKGIKKDL